MKENSKKKQKQLNFTKKLANREFQENLPFSRVSVCRLKMAFFQFFFREIQKQIFLFKFMLNTKISLSSICLLLIIL